MKLNVLTSVYLSFLHLVVRDILNFCENKKKSFTKIFGKIIHILCNLQHKSNALTKKIKKNKNTRHGT